MKRALLALAALTVVLAPCGVLLADAGRTFAPTRTEALAIGALVERERALQEEVQAVLREAAAARQLAPGALGWDARRGLLVELAPVSTASRP